MVVWHLIRVLSGQFFVELYVPLHEGLGVLPRPAEEIISHSGIGKT